MVINGRAANNDWLYIWPFTRFPCQPKTLIGLQHINNIIVKNYFHFERFAFLLVQIKTFQLSP